MSQLNAPDEEMLVGRGEVLRRVDAWLMSIRRGVGVCVVVFGASAVGSTAVLDAVSRRAALQGATVLEVGDAGGLAAAAFSPCVMIVHDVDQREPAFEQALLSRGTQVRALPILLIATTHADLGSVARYARAGFELVQLSPLDDDAIAAIVRLRARARSIDLDDECIARIVGSAAGYPRHAVELALEPAAMIPQSVRASIEQFDRIHGPEATGTLSLLAVTAMQDDRPDLTLARRLESRLSRRPFEAALIAAHEAGFIDRDQRFTHPLVRAGFETRLGASVHRLHARCAKALLGERPTMERFAVIAEHFRAAQMNTRAVEFELVVANDAATDGRYFEAAERYGRVLRLGIASPPRRAKTYLESARTLVHLAELSAAIEQFKSAMDIYAELEDAESLANVAVEMAKTQTRALDFQGAFATCRRALKASGHRPSGQTHVMLLIISATVALAEQDEARIRRVFATLEQGLGEVPEALQWNVSRTRGLYHLLYPSSTARDGGAVAMVHFQESVRWAEEAGDLYGLSTAYNYLGYGHILRGEMMLAKSSLQRSLEAACLSSDRGKIALAYCGIMQLASLEGELPRVLALADLMEETVPGAREFCDEHVTIAVARAAALLREPRAMNLSTYRETFEKASLKNDLTGLQNAAAGYCMIAIALGSPQVVEGVIDAVLPRVKQAIPETPELLFLSATYGSALVVTQARALIADLRPIISGSMYRAFIELFDALCSRRQGKTRTARSHAAAAAEAFGSIGWKWFQVQALRAGNRDDEARAVESSMGVVHDEDEHVTSLSPREVTIARLAATGRANREIAELLAISEKTIQVHMVSILRKLEIKSRHQIADLIDAPPTAVRP